MEIIFLFVNFYQHLLNVTNVGNIQCYRNEEIYRSIR